jgi:hypothetical protein
VKINCKKVSEALQALGKDQDFKQLQSSLDTLHREVSESINNGNGGALAASTTKAAI